MADATHIRGPVVVKVGGSLFDWPDLGPRLHRWLAALACRQVVLVPGGGAAADIIADLDQCHNLHEESAHWLALRAVTLNAHFLAALLGGSQAIVTANLQVLAAHWAQGRLALLDGYQFALEDECRPHCLPHCWKVTTDSLAARLAIVTGARSLVLLKSVTIPEGFDCHEASRCGFVDSYFNGTIEGGSPELAVGTVNLRDWQPGQRVAAWLRVGAPWGG